MSHETATRKYDALSAMGSIMSLSVKGNPRNLLEMQKNKDGHEYTHVGAAHTTQTRTGILLPSAMVLRCRGGWVVIKNGRFDTGS